MIRLMLSSFRSPIVQRYVTALYTACLFFIYTMDRVMTARFTALNGHPPDLSNYASYYDSSGIWYETVFCEHDRWFALCAAVFHSEIRYDLACIMLIISLIALLALSTLLKQKYFAVSLCVLIGAYVVVLWTPMFLMPLSRYYLIHFGLIHFGD